MSKALHEYLSPKHKVLEFLKKGHDALRVKYADLMVRLRRAENQVRAVTKSRENWETRAKAVSAQQSREIGWA